MRRVLASKGFLDIAVHCAKSGSSDPNTLLRSCRDFADKDFTFSLIVGVLAIIRLMAGTFHEKITAADIAYAYQQVEKIAKDKSKLADFKTLFAREIMKQPCKDDLSEIVIN